MLWRKDKREEVIEKMPESTEKTMVECRACGFRGTMEDFLKLDPGDTRCPRCEEDDDLVFEL